MAISTNSRPNSNPRNSETNSPMRRSFSGNPFPRTIHTNNPAEITRSNSLGMEEKENEFDHHTPKQPVKARSPSVGNGTNHFMLPTISASSKFNPSPKKKVLSDKNEPCKSPSVPINTSDFTKDSDQKLDSSFETPCDTNHLSKGPSRNSHTPIYPKLSDKKPIMGSSTKTLDADPSSIPPYDPKTNYLSPRPQFLHYKPNPRIELYYQKEQNSGANNLEDMFFSESSDTEVSESDNASSVEAINGSIEKESEDASSIEAVSEEAVRETIITPISTLVFEDASEEKRVVKSRFLTRAKVVPLLIVMLIACLSMSYTDSPIFDLPVHKNLSHSKFYEESFEGFPRNLKVWSDYSASYVNELISSFSGGDKVNNSQFSNLTYVLENPFTEVKNRADEIYDQDKVEEPVFKDENELENNLDLQNYIDLDDKSCLEARELGPEEATNEVIKGEDHLVYDSKTESPTAVSNFENAYVMDILLSEVQNLEQGDHIVFDSETDPSVAVPSFRNTFELGGFQVDIEDHIEISETMEIKKDDSVISDSVNTMNVDALTSDHIPEYKFLNQYEALVISLLAIAVIASPVLFYLKKKHLETSIYTVHIDRIPTNKTMKMNPTTQNYSPESCPSEMSSICKSYSYSKGGIGGTTDEAQSQEKKQKRFSKRESLASSSEFSMDDSPSYGSFTTYERLPGKYGYGDDEVVNPVRRSSRIKKSQVTSS